MVKAIVIGASYGGMEAIKTITTKLPQGFKVPVCIVLHIGNYNIGNYLSMLNNNTNFNVKEAEEKETLSEGIIYFAPPNYHLQIERDYTFSLSTDQKINYSRPSIDVLFETAAWAFKENLLGVLLTGSNRDGAEGLKTIKKYGGITIVQTPKTATAKNMPEKAIQIEEPTYIVDLEHIAEKIIELVK